MDHQSVRMRLQRRHAWLAAIACLHLAALMAWRGGPLPRPTLPQREGELLLIHLPTAQRPATGLVQAVTPPAPRAAAQRTRQERDLAQRDPSGSAAAARAEAAPALPAPVVSPAPTVAQALPITVPAPAPSMPADPFAQAAAPALDTTGRARLAAGSIDRQLRKESLNKFATIVDPDKADRYSIHGPAYRPPPPPGSFADGRGIIHKRHMVRGRMVCETVDHVSPQAMSGSIARYVKCPE